MASEFDASLHQYLSVNGKLLTPFTNYFASGATLAALTANTLGDIIEADDYRELVLNVSAGTPTGTSPTLTVKLIVLDPAEPNNSTVLTLILNSIALTVAGTLRFVISRSGQATVWVNGAATSLGTLTVPQLFQVSFVIGGTTPSWPILGTYELRR